MVTDIVEAKTVSSLQNTLLDGIGGNRHVNVETIETRDVLVVLAPSVEVCPEILVQLSVGIDGENALFLPAKLLIFKMGEDI